MGSNTVALISHGAMLRSWAGYYCQNLDAQYEEANPLPNTGIIEVTGSAHSGWTAES
jgi:probable phosphoglycerate mutase